MPRVGVEVQGVVQGVGFRPFVYRLAMARGLRGWVRNRPDGVEIEVQGRRTDLDGFLKALREEKPQPARIQAVASRELPERPDEESFTILATAASEGTRPSLPADLALCPACAQEIATPGERRYRYPFTNCTTCGPRYTILASLPYDRPRTAMAGFPLCAECRAQYENPADRRFHAQPIACPACGPKVTYRKGPVDVVGEAALTAAAGLLAEGGILALKGLGGYQLLTDATSTAAVLRLRARKHREEKPFAVMFPDLANLKACCRVSATEEALLLGPEAPILLLERCGKAVAAEVAPGNPRLGAFLPYTPLHRLLLGDRPLVCTSGNLSEEPMCITDDEARERLQGLADAFLTHDRPILRPLDDSVGWVDGATFRLLRRARGFAPLPHPVALVGPCTLALGGHLKSTIALLDHGQAVVSQHLGDLDSPQSRALLERTVEDVLQFFQAEPVRLACDLHPDYASTLLAERLAKARGIPLVRVQHHHAHIAACAAEKGLQGLLLGLAWDGSGYGDDGTLWGGEAMAVAGARYARIGHLAPFPLPGGERAVREPRRSALGLCWTVLGEAGPTADLFTSEELPPLLTMLDRAIHAPMTSSIGRLFDAVAALVGLRTGQTSWAGPPDLEVGGSGGDVASGASRRSPPDPCLSFEGQAAMALEFAAASEPENGAYGFVLRDGVADPKPLLLALLEDRRRGVGAGVMARRFHTALGDLAVAFARLENLEDIVLTGGCFQNRLLADLCERRLLRAGFRVHRPALFPPNDGGLSLGQAWVAAQAEV